MPVDPKTRRELAQSGRLWGLSLICATAGATTIYLTDDLFTGIVVFLVTLVVLGSVLWSYEKRHKK